MRRFHSYGPVDSRFHYCVERREMVEQCVLQIVGSDEEGGHYFTIWAPRQTGKTWLMRRAIEKIQAEHGDRYTVGRMSMQGVVLTVHPGAHLQCIDRRSGGRAIAHSHAGPAGRSGRRVRGRFAQHNRVDRAIQAVSRATEGEGHHNT